MDEHDTDEHATSGPRWHRLDSRPGPSGWITIEVAVATGCRRVAEPRPDGHEHLEVLTLSLTEFRDHLRSGRLTDRGASYRALDELSLLGKI